MPQQMDDELLQQAQAGEESAIAALITAMMPAIVKVKAGCCNGSGAFAYGRHHGGDQRGNSAFLPSLSYAKAPLPLQHPALTLTMRCRKG